MKIIWEKKTNLGDSSHPSATFPNVEWAKNDEFVYKVKTMIEKLPLLIQNSLITKRLRYHNWHVLGHKFWLSQCFGQRSDKIKCTKYCKLHTLQTTSFISKVFENCSRKKQLKKGILPNAVKTMIEKLQLLIQNSLIEKNYDTIDLHNVLVKDQVRICIPQIK